MQEFHTVDVVRLEVETDTAGLKNLIQNPRGDLGGWGWLTPVVGSTVDVPNGGGTLIFHGVAGASWFTSEALPVVAGQYVSARWDTQGGGGWYRARFEWLDTNGAVLSSSTQTAYLAAGSGVALLAPVQAPASTANARLRFDLYKTNTGTNHTGPETFWFTDVTAAKAATSGELAATRTNLVPNPSFETNTTGWTVSGPSLVRTNLSTNPSFEVSTAGWAKVGSDAFSRVSGVSGSVGTWCLEFGPPTSATRGFVRAPQVSVTPGKSYTINLRQRSHATAHGSGGIRVRWYNASGTDIGGADYDQALAGGWTLYSKTVVAPAGAAYFVWWVYFTPSDPGAILSHVDGVLIEESAAAGVYFDGSTTASGGWTYNWTGTAHLSTSTGTKSAVTAGRASPAGVPAGTVALALNLDAAAPAGTVTASSDPLPVSPSADYAAQARVMTPTNAGDVRMSLEWRTSGGTPISTVAGPLSDSADGVWELRSIIGTAPANAASVVVSVSFASVGAGAAHYADAVMVERASAVNAYFDGSTAAGGGWVYSWTGTSNSSASQAVASTLPYIPPVQYLDIIGEAHQIRVTREELNIGTLNATVLSSSLDPSQSTLIRPGRKARLSVLLDGVAWKTVLGGELQEATVAYEVKDPRVPEEKRARITLMLVDPTKTVANAGRPEGVATINELPYVLEGVGVPWNVNGSGSQVPAATVTTYNENAKALDQVALTRDTRLGYAWMSNIGVLNVWDRDLIDSGSPALLNETTYSDLDLSYSTNDCINEVQITVQSVGTDGSPVETPYGPYVDSASIEEWGRYRKEFTVTGLNAAAVDALAASILAAASTPRIRVNSITLPLNTTARLNAHALRDLYDEVRVVLAAKGVDDTLRVTSIEHTITTDKWLLKLGFSDEGGVAQPTVQPPMQTGVRPDVGVIEMYGGSTAPPGKLLCNGASYPVADYPYLFAVIGYTFGGSGANFNVPNLVDRFPIGKGTKALGTTGGSPTVTLNANHLPPHTHAIARQTSAGTTTNVALGGATAAGAGATGNNTTANNPVDILNPWLAVTYVIRAV